MLFHSNHIQSFPCIEVEKQRIISLVPSLTELLYDLGLEDEVIGITKFCVHPALWFKQKPRIGGTKNINVAKVKQLEPTLVIASKEENVKEQVEAIASFTNVLLTDVTNLASATNAIENIGVVVQKKTAAQQLSSGIQKAFEALKQDVSKTRENTWLRTVYLIWQNPYMAAGSGTFIHDMLSYCGLQNVLAAEQRYPQVTLQQLAEQKCELLLLSSEPFPFAQKHVDEIACQLPGTRVVLVDGEMFSWYGSRLLLSATYFKTLIAELSAVPPQNIMDTPRL